MERGLLATLSPNEEVTLRRIAPGTVLPDVLREIDVTRLSHLGLIERRGRALGLTELGTRRVAQLPNNNLGAGPVGTDAHTVAMAKHLGIGLK
jgi:hypothetical protein